MQLFDDLVHFVDSFPQGIPSCLRILVHSGNLPIDRQAILESISDDCQDLLDSRTKVHLSLQICVHFLCHSIRINQMLTGIEGLLDLGDGLLDRPDHSFG